MSSAVRADLTSDLLIPQGAPGWQLLKTRDFGLLFWGQMTSQIGDSFLRINASMYRE